MKKQFYLFVLLLLLTGCSTTRYYLVRHAEKTSAPKDPGLSPAGMQRALALRDSLLAAHIDHLYATPYRRTQLTARPLADALGKKVIRYDPRDGRGFVEKMKKENNKNILIIGHSNTVPEMVLYFTGDTVHIAHHEYAHLFLIKKRKNIFNEKYILVKKTYGTADR